jgi:hypothetical protein
MLVTIDGDDVAYAVYASPHPAVAPLIPLAVVTSVRTPHRRWNEPSWLCWVGCRGWGLGNGREELEG